MFAVEALDQGFMGKRARLRALGSSTEWANDVVAVEDGYWANGLRDGVAEGDVVTVTLPASLTVEVGQALKVPGL